MEETQRQQPTPPPTAKAGDKVMYVPDKIHALRPDANGKYPWVLGKKVTVIKDRKKEIEIQEIGSEGKGVNAFVTSIRRSPNPAKAMEQLVFLRPADPWPATVSAIHEDGSADLDVKSNQGGVTLHLPNVPADPAGTTPHSYHAATADKEGQ